MPTTIFERYPKTTLLGLIFLGLCALIVILEIVASTVFGLGKTVLYDTHPVYGYRPRPNQVVARKTEYMIKTNNYALRAQQDWDPTDAAHQILFLGDSVTYGGSYISNEQLFSHLATENLSGFIGGNAGVNAWGVNNVCALIKEMDFIPANIYVSVFPEGDFYRGLSRIGGQPFWTRQPRFALEELFFYFTYKMQLKISPPTRLDPADKAKVADLTVANLKTMDAFLKANNHYHLIYITPSRSQLLNKAPIDTALKALFEEFGLEVIYIKDRLGKISPDEVESLYHDDIHLSAHGHQVWANIIMPDLQEITQFEQTENLMAMKE